MVADAHGDGGKGGEKDVVEGKCPGFEDDLAGEGILEGVLLDCVRVFQVGCRGRSTYPKLCHEQGNIFVEGVKDDFADALITPRPMHKQELPEISELAN